jgi:hypothetical protein
MKKIILMFGSLLLFSCSNNESVNDGSTTGVILVKKIVYSDGEENTFNYNDTKLTKVNMKGGYTNITYSGDLIIKTEGFEANNTLQVVEFNYSLNKLSQIKTYSSPNKLETIQNYSYNSDGTITIAESYYNSLNVLTNINRTKNYYDTAGNKIKTEVLENNNVVRTLNYTYDTKNSPFKNITGIHVLFLNNYSEGSVINNLTNGPNSSKSYQYNSQNYPVSEKEVQIVGGGTITATYFY